MSKAIDNKPKKKTVFLVINITLYLTLTLLILNIYTLNVTPILGLFLAIFNIILLITFGYTHERIRDVYETELMSRSITDQLTGLYNRRKFDELLELEMERAFRYKRPLSLILFDIDNFKEINDTYGHQKGDIVLKKLSKLTSEVIRHTDMSFRTGGDEFAVICTETPDGNDVKSAAERIREVTPKIKFGIKKFTVTITLGCTELDKEDTFDTLYARADRALYKAKHKGRNRTIVLKANIPNK